MDILVAMDRSTESENAFVNAMDIVSSMGGRVIAVHVADSEADGGEDIVQRAVERGTKRGVSVDTEVLAGDPIEEIPEFAERCGADAIYLGHRGLSHASEAISGQPRGELGSVAKGIVERSTIPVTVFDRGL